jgi:7-cyano-7-deazaguanine synthase
MSVYNDVVAKTENITKVNKVVVSLSGGLDSTTLLYLMVKKFGKENVHAISYNYNQRHGDVELEQAKKTAQKLGVVHKLIDISFLGEMTKGVSAMVKGNVATPTMEDVLGEPQPVTYQPFRNLILASLTAAYAESIGANGIALGIQRIDSYAYWDVSPEFYDAVGGVFKLNRKHQIFFIAPFITLSKVEEIKLGGELGIDYGSTWTCYQGIIDKEETFYEDEPAGGKNPKIRKHFQPCGTCPSCFERRESFKKAGVRDPVIENGVWV